MEKLGKACSQPVAKSIQFENLVISFIDKCNFLNLLGI